MASPLTKDEQEAKQELVKRLEAIIASEQIPRYVVAAMSGLSNYTFNKTLKGEAPIDNLIKVYTALGYEVVFARVKSAKKISDDVDAVTRLIKNKNKINKHGKAKEQPNDRRTGKQDTFLSNE